MTPAMLPANLAEAQSDLAKMGAMISAIDAADAAIRATAQNEGLLEQNMTVEQTSAYLTPNTWRWSPGFRRWMWRLPR